MQAREIVCARLTAGPFEPFRFSSVRCRGQADLSNGVSNPFSSR